MAWEPLPRNLKDAGATFPGWCCSRKSAHRKRPGSQVFKGEGDPPGGKAELVGNIPGIPGVCSPEPANNTAAFLFLNGFRTTSREISYVQSY